MVSNRKTLLRKILVIGCLWLRHPVMHLVMLPIMEMILSWFMLNWTYPVMQGMGTDSSSELEASIPSILRLSAVRQCPVHLNYPVVGMHSRRSKDVVHRTEGWKICACNESVVD